MPTPHDIAEMLSANRTGYSVNTSGKRPYAGYMVSVPGNELVLDEWSDLTVDEWVQSNWTAVHDDAWGYYYFGVWQDEETGKFYLDVSDQHLSDDVARDTAERYGQLAYYDVANAKEIRL